MPVNPNKIDFLVILRIFLGLVFVVSGIEKLLTPYQNFQYVIENYHVLPSVMEAPVAQVLPWVEFFTGVFVVTGLWLKWALRFQAAFFCMFIVVVSQALIRHLPIDECGCFGQLISFPLYGVLIMDSVFLVLTAVLIRESGRSSRFSLDNQFNKIS